MQLNRFGRFCNKSDYFGLLITKAERAHLSSERQATSLSAVERGSRDKAKRKLKGRKKCKMEEEYRMRRAGDPK